jgi:hypothetical protein
MDGKRKDVDQGDGAGVAIGVVPVAEDTDLEGSWATGGMGGLGCRKRG